MHMPSKFAQATDDALLGVVAHGTGIHEDDVRSLGVFRMDVAGSRELPEHQLGVRDIHLAAVRFEVDGRHWSKATGEPGARSTRPSAPSRAAGHGAPAEAGRRR